MMIKMGTRRARLCGVSDWSTVKVDRLLLGGLVWLVGGRSRCGFSDVWAQCLRVMEEEEEQD